jgi:dolichyl-phosphate beta-glucosyltransferase
VTPRLSVVVPAYNEGTRIASTVQRLRDDLADLAAEGGLEVLVVDDGSSDDTASEAERAGGCRLLVHPQNRGKGAAVRTGMQAATGTTVAFTDADLAYAPDQLRTVLNEVEQGADVVVGSRRHPRSSTVVEASLLRSIGSRVINWLTRLVLEGSYRDTQSGLKGFRSEAAAAIFDHTTIDGMGFDIEVLCLAERYGLTIREVPVRVATSPTSSVRVVRDGLRLVRDVFAVRRRRRDGEYDLTAEQRAALLRG